MVGFFKCFALSISLLVAGPALAGDRDESSWGNSKQQQDKKKDSKRGSSSSESTSSSLPSYLDFRPDKGIRVKDAGVPWAVKTKKGNIRLYVMVDNKGEMVARSSNGLDFDQPTARKKKDAYDPTRVKLPNGKWRRYSWDEDGCLRSKISKDGLDFRDEWGCRYRLRDSDHGQAGMYDVYSLPDKGVVLLYIGDMKGKNNVRMATSKRNGRKFKFKDGNVLGDRHSGGGPKSFVDQKSIKLKKGKRRLFTMRDGKIYSFTSKDGGLSYKADPGPILAPSDFKGMNVVLLHDPTVVKLSDGRYRMYVGASIASSGSARGADPSKLTHAVLSATSR